MLNKNSYIKYIFSIAGCGFLMLWLFSSFNTVTDPPVKKMFTVVLDAGHGGHDPGNVGNGFREKDIALRIVLEIGDILKKRGDVKVVYTRNDDTFVDLFVRGQIANKANADLFVSVHCNAHDSQAHGTETFVLGLHANKQNFEIAKKENSVIYLEENHEVNYAGYNINSPESLIGLTMLQEEFLDQSILLAKYIQDSFTKKLYRNDRGVKQAGFIVLHQTFMPSVLVETGFLTYKDEGRYLNSRTGQSSMANSIAESILKYKKAIEENTGEDISLMAMKGNSENTVSNQNGKIGADATKDNPASAIEFRVQISASSRKLETKSFNFNGLTPISREKLGNLYKYYYGSTGNYEEAKVLQKKALSKGFDSAFIVAFKNDVKISIDEALKTVSN